MIIHVLGPLGAVMDAVSTAFLYRNIASGPSVVRRTHAAKTGPQNIIITGPQNIILFRANTGGNLLAGVAHQDGRKTRSQGGAAKPLNLKPKP